MNSDEYKRGYSRGYSAGLRRDWSEIAPPAPPKPLVRDYFAAVNALRDAVLSVTQTLCDDDQWVRELQPRINEVDEQTQRIIKWLAEGTRAVD